MIPAEVIYRVFRLKVGQQSGTGFAIEEDGKEYLVTARHLAKPLCGDCQIRLFKNGAWSPLEISTVGHGAGDTDISVLAPSKRLTPVRPLPLQVSSEGLVYGQDAYFLVSHTASVTWFWVRLAAHFRLLNERRSLHYSVSLSFWMVTTTSAFLVDL